MGSVDQSFETSEHVTFKRGLVIIEHAIHTSPSQIFTAAMKSQAKTSLTCENLIKECIAFNNGISAFNPYKVST